MTQTGLRFEGMASDGEFSTVRELVAAATRRLDPTVLTFVEAGAADEVTARANREAFLHWWLVPRYAPSGDGPQIAARLLGRELPAPLFTAPFGLDHLLHPNGILEVARAHRDLPIPLVLSRSTAAPLEEVAKAAHDVPLLLQLLPTGHLDDFVEMARRARDAGFVGLVVTMDGAALGWRDRCREERFSPDMSQAWGNYRLPDGGIDGERLHRVEVARQPQLSYEAIEEGAQAAGLPWIAKGVLSVPEAARAVAAGCGAVYVSNHGGRALDGVPPTLAVLPEVADHLGGAERRIPVLFDGGVRRGNDVLKALALGADLVGFAGVVAAALAAGGERAVRRLFELLAQELDNGMRLLGRASVDELGADCVRRAT